VADLFPAYQILTVKNGEAWKIGKGRIDNVIIITGTANAWIRVETGKDRVGIRRLAV
jgi:hypothetical protein